MSFDGDERGGELSGARKVSTGEEGSLMGIYSQGDKMYCVGEEAVLKEGRGMEGLIFIDG